MKSYVCALLFYTLNLSPAYGWVVWTQAGGQWVQAEEQSDELERVQADEQNRECEQEIEPEPELEADDQVK